MAPSKTAMKTQSANVGAVPTGGEEGELLMVYSLSRKKRDKSLKSIAIA
jgi:hypothetical protein